MGLPANIGTCLTQSGYNWNTAKSFFLKKKNLCLCWFQHQAPQLTLPESHAVSHCFQCQVWWTILHKASMQARENSIMCFMYDRKSLLFAKSFPLQAHIRILALVPIIVWLEFAGTNRTMVPMMRMLFQVQETYQKGQEIEVLPLSCLLFSAAALPTAINRYYQHAYREKNLYRQFE